MALNKCLGIGGYGATRRCCTACAHAMCAELTVTPMEESDVRRLCRMLGAEVSQRVCDATLLRIRASWPLPGHTTRHAKRRDCAGTIFVSHGQPRQVAPVVLETSRDDV